MFDTPTCVPTRIIHSVLYILRIPALCLRKPSGSVFMSPYVCRFTRIFKRVCRSCALNTRARLRTNWIVAVRLVVIADVDEDVVRYDWHLTMFVVSVFCLLCLSRSRFFLSFPDHLAHLRVRD